ncbi:hypothetical protein Mal65_53980 [Crateriforma conspicua]|nr:hypothetical protein Mal65_53980 [Crateriforma conspicua]
MRPLTVIGVLLCLHVFPGRSADSGEPTLVGLVSHWTFPGSTFISAELSDGEMLGSDGERTQPSVKGQFKMATDASVSEVVAYYREKLANDTSERTEATWPISKGGRSVWIDQSDERSFELATVLVITRNTCTSLIVTRSSDEKETKIDWKQHRRVN